jgi:hypothetical protein
MALLIIAPHMDLHTSWVADEGAYGLEVHSVLHGTWQYHYVAAPVDPSGRWFPIINGAGGSGALGGRYYAYVKHPLDVILPWASVKAFGSRLGYDLPSMLGALLTAIAAWLLAAEFDRRIAPVAFWLAALSPVAINAYLLWAHALSAGVAGLTAWAAVKFWRSHTDGRSRGDWRWGAAVIVGIAAGVGLRSEGLLFGVALAVVTGAALAASGRWRAAAAITGAGAAVALACRWLETVVVSAIVHQHYAGGADGTQGVDRSSYVASRFRGAGHDLLAGSEYTQHAGHLLAAALLLVVIAGLALRWWHKAGVVIAGPALLFALWLYHLRFRTNPLESATGLLAAWPVLLLALLCLRRPPRWDRARVPAFLLAVSVLFTAGVVATDYAVGGGLEWGGRFLSPILAPLAVVAAACLSAALSAMTRGRRLIAITLIAGLALLPTALGLEMLRLYRLDKDTFYNEVASRASSVILIDGPLEETPRAGWRLDPSIHFLVAYSDGSARAALTAMRQGGFTDVTLLKLKGDSLVDGSPYTSVTDVTGPVLTHDSWQLLRLRG